MTKKKAGKKRKSILKKAGTVLLAVICTVGVGVVVLNGIAVVSGGKELVPAAADGTVSEEDGESLRTFGADAALILGCGIRDEETPSDMLRDRLETGIFLYRQGIVKKLLLSGDNERHGHNEIHVMLRYCLEAGIPAEDLFCDHAGISTYDSMYRAQSVFGGEKIIVVTQKYHEYRALFTGKTLGMEVRGVGADPRQYRGEAYRECREILARCKDVVKAVFRVPAKYGGEPFDLSGDGRETYDEVLP